MTATPGSLIVISGPSGAGKSTVIGKVLEQNPTIYFSVSCTTRRPRPAEKHGVDYYFMEMDEFQSMIDNGSLLEHAVYVGNCYGTPSKPAEEQIEAGNDVLLDIEVQGAEQVRKSRPNAIFIFVMPPNLKDLENRLRSRGTDSEEKIRERLERARGELRYALNYDYLVINDTVERAANEITSILLAERCRMSRRKNLLEEL